VSTHRTFVANLQYPRFSGSPSFGDRADDVARAVRARGCDSAVFGEAGYRECSTLSEQLKGWQYDRAQGRGRGVNGEGLNSVWSDPDVWRQPEDRLSDYDLPSFGQWQRTALGARLEETGDPSAFCMLFAVHFAAVGSPLARAGANRAKLAQIKYLRKKTGGRRVQWMGDIPRTDDDDDLAYLKREGFRFASRSSATPLAVVVQGAVTVHDVKRYPHGSMFDHDYLVAEWSVAGKKEQA